MDDFRLLPEVGTTRRDSREDGPAPEPEWQKAVLQGEAVPAVASLYQIEDLQHWIDLSA